MKKASSILTALVTLSLLLSSCGKIETVEFTDTEKWLEGKWVYKHTIRYGQSTTDEVDWRFNSLQLALGDFKLNNDTSITKNFAIPGTLYSFDKTLNFKYVAPNTAYFTLPTDTVYHLYTRENGEYKAQDNPRRELKGCWLLDSVIIDGKHSNEFLEDDIVLRLSDIEPTDKERVINGVQYCMERGISKEEYQPIDFDSIGEYHYRWLCNGELHYEGCLEETIAPDKSRQALRLNSRNACAPNNKSKIFDLIHSCKFKIYGDQNQYLWIHITPGMIIKMHYICEK